VRLWLRTPTGAASERDGRRCVRGGAQRELGGSTRAKGQELLQAEGGADGRDQRRRRPARRQVRQRRPGRKKYAPRPNLSLLIH